MSLRDYAVRFVVSKLIDVLRASIQNDLEKLPLANLLALNFEVCAFVRSEARKMGDPNHAPSYYSQRIAAHPLYQMIQAEFIKRDSFSYEKWNPFATLNEAQIKYNLQTKSRKHAKED